MERGGAMVWSVIGWILLGLLGLLVLLVVLPTVVYVSYRGGTFTLKLRVLFVKLTLFTTVPTRKRKRKPKKEKPSKPQKTEAPKKEKPKKTIEEMLVLVKRIASSAGVFMRVFLRFLRIRDVELVLPVSAGEAADTALRCGRVQMLIGTTRAVLEERVHIRYTRLVVLPDFAGQYGQSSLFSCKIAASPVIMLAAAIGAGIHFLRYKEVSYSRADYLRAHPNLRRAAVANTEGANKHGER